MPGSPPHSKGQRRGTETSLDVSASLLEKALTVDRRFRTTVLAYDRLMLLVARSGFESAPSGAVQVRSSQCGIRMYSMTMTGTCATHVLTKAKPKAVWSRRLQCMQVSLCWWSVNCCVQACKQTQRDTQGTKRAKCVHVGQSSRLANLGS